LIGIKEDKSANGEAVEFLKLKTRNQKVYMKFDNLYLKNKTFINAHLIKKGLVLVDNQREYKHKHKFLNLRKS